MPAAGLQGGPRGDLTSHQLSLLALLCDSGLVLAAGTFLSADVCGGKKAVPPLCSALAMLLCLWMSSLGYAGMEPDPAHGERLLVLLLQGRALGFVHACCAPVVFWVLRLWLCLSSAATSGEGIFQSTDVPAKSPFVRNREVL